MKKVKAWIAHARSTTDRARKRVGLPWPNEMHPMAPGPIPTTVLGFLQNKVTGKIAILVCDDPWAEADHIHELSGCDIRVLGVLDDPTRERDVCVQLMPHLDAGCWYHADAFHDVHAILSESS